MRNCQLLSLLLIIFASIGIYVIYDYTSRVYNEAMKDYLSVVLEKVWYNTDAEREYDVISTLKFTVGTDVDTNFYWQKIDDIENTGTIKMDSVCQFTKVLSQWQYDILYDSNLLRLERIFEQYKMTIDSAFKNSIVALAVVDSAGELLVCSDSNLNIVDNINIFRTSGLRVGYKYEHRIVVCFEEFNLYSGNMVGVVSSVNLILVVICFLMLLYALKLDKNLKIRNLQFSYLKHEVVKPLTMLEERVAFMAEEENNTKLVGVKNYIGKVINASHVLLAADSELNINKEECDLQQIINAVVEIYGSVYRNVEWRVNVDKQVGKQLLDKKGVLMVVSNIIDNAIKHNDCAIPKISVSCVRKDNLLEMKITDNGPGIEKRYLKKIFLSDLRVPTNVKKMKTGMGIGLPLAKKIVKAHGGEIWAESEFGKGCCIVVQIPIFDYGT